MKEIEAPYMLDWEHGIALTQCRGFGPHLTVRGKSHGFSRVAAGTWAIFSSYSGDGHSKLEFVQRHNYSCLVKMDISGI